MQRALGSHIHLEDKTYTSIQSMIKKRAIKDKPNINYIFPVTTWKILFGKKKRKLQGRTSLGISNMPIIFLGGNHQHSILDKFKEVNSIDTQQGPRIHNLKK